MGAANVDPAPLMVDDPDDVPPLDELLHAAPISTMAAAAMPAAAPREAGSVAPARLRHDLAPARLRNDACTILMMAPPSQTFRPGPA